MTSEFAGRRDLELESLRAYAHDAVDWMVDYLTGLGDEPILKPEAPKEVFDRFRATLPREGAPPHDVFQEFQDRIVPSVTTLQHPGNLGYIPNSAGVIGIVGDLLASTLNQNVSLVRGGPSAAAVEAQVVTWIQELLDYPRDGGGILTSGGSLGNLMGLALARERAGGSAVREPVVYVSEETHSSIERALRFLGLPRSTMRHVAVDDGFRMDASAAEKAIDADRAAGRTPLAIVGTAGTIGSGAVDPLDSLAAICAREGMWLHVDGAYGALAAAAPSGAWMRSGLGKADSVSLDPHKWLFVPIDVSCLLVRDVEHMRRFFTVTPEYLKVVPSELEGGVRQPAEHTVELSRRFRALKLWMAIKTYGADAIRERIEDHLNLAQTLASWVEASDAFELSAPVMTSSVCFRYRPDGRASDEELDELNESIMHAINRVPGLFVSRNRLAGRFTLRACITGLRTTRRDVERFWAACNEVAPSLR